MFFFDFKTLREDLVIYAELGGTFSGKFSHCCKIKFGKMSIIYHIEDFKLINVQLYFF